MKKNLHNIDTERIVEGLSSDMLELKSEVSRLKILLRKYAKKTGTFCEMYGHYMPEGWEEFETGAEYEQCKTCGKTRLPERWVDTPDKAQD